ncbi:MAG: hypothetical protein F6K50_03580 [Moorea sp. SIO3I7]|uniref:hypothetical protein n=1 Tax=Moorena sp. SIO3I8 TaxID=2607833 RepID=UPI0013BF1A5E|nr:hypothetical protein [Moorena sp. SIO3I8]NEN94640.1 hypothetical protein [Moorena sp. SIO3I7]NEO04248.1 hypothetical protein [Moorena sp. SIO3I8]
MFLFLILIGGITDWSRLKIRGTGILPVSIDHGMGIRRGTGILPVSIDHGMGIRRGTGILPVSIDHGMGILVELASCQFQ